MPYTNFKTMRYRGCINLDTKDLYLSHVSPKYRRLLETKHLTYEASNLNIDEEIHEAIKELKW